MKAKKCQTAKCLFKVYLGFILISISTNSYSQVAKIIVNDGDRCHIDRQFNRGAVLDGRNSFSTGNSLIRWVAGDNQWKILLFGFFETHSSNVDSDPWPPCDPGDWTSFDTGLGGCGELTVFDCIDFPPLPIELISFEGKTVPNGNSLTWTTVSEINNEGFSVQRSLDGIQFTEIAFIQGQGTTSKESNYTFIDTTPKPNGNYYRLEQFDYSGQSSFSEVIFVNNHSIQDQVQIFPNPTSGYITIVTGENFDKIEVFDPFGNQLLNTNFFPGVPYEFDLSNLADGFYYVLITGKEVPRLISFVKNSK